jgi:hypothetical protein
MDKRNKLTILVGKPLGKCIVFEDQEGHARIVLRWILEKRYVGFGGGWNWLRMGFGIRSI